MIRRRNLRFPDDFVDGEAFADGVHHLAAEEFESAAFDLVESVFAPEITIEILQSSSVRLGFGLSSGGEGFLD